MKTLHRQPLIRPDLHAYISSQALLNNVKNLKSLTPPATKFCAVVKANAYGHGITEIVSILKDSDVDFFAVATVYEAVHIAQTDRQRPILILEPINSAVAPEMIELCAKNNFHCMISSLDAIEFVEQRLAGTDHILGLHVNVESGMGRCGLDTKEALQLIGTIEQSPNARLAGVCTHFATADEEDLSYADQQLNTFNEFLAVSRVADDKNIIVHAANSAATIKMPDSHFDMVRCGIAMYGYYSRAMAKPPIRLRPVMKVQAPIVQMKKIPKGRSVSYGQSYITTRDTIAAIIPLGYADGYWRCFSNKAKMKLGDKVVNVIGRVCMDQVIIDVTDIAEVSLGQMVTVIDDRHDSPCGAYALADLADTICYEILTSVHSHVNRIIH
jgi:alanine racemase